MPQIPVGFSDLPSYNWVHIVYNFLVLVLGITVTTSSLVVLSQITNHIEELLPALKISLLIIPITGILSLTLIFFGLEGIRKQNPVLISCEALFSLILAILFAINSASILQFVDDISSGSFPTKFKNLIANYENGSLPSVKNQVNYIQSEYRCCGSFSSVDWLPFKVHNDQLYPSSCCPKSLNEYDAVECRYLNIHKKLCPHAVRAVLEPYCMTTAISGFVFMIVLLLGTFWSWFLMKILQQLDSAQESLNFSLWPRRPETQFPEQTLDPEIRRQLDELEPTTSVESVYRETVYDENENIQPHQERVSSHGGRY